MPKNYTLDMLAHIELNIEKPSVIFLYGDLGAGKTTLSQAIIKRVLGKNDLSITSPTYVYYNKYENIYHFDLYRLKDYDEFVSIGGEEVLDNNQGVILVEWPQILEAYYTPDIKIYIEKNLSENEREIRVEYI